MSLLEIHGVGKVFDGASSPALAEIDARFEAGESVGVVGESGSGKTTLARILLGLEQPTEGSVLFRSAPLAASGPAWRAARRELQHIPQHASGALNPRMTVRAHFAEVIRAHDLAPRDEIAELVAQRLAEVSLGPELADAYPRRLSGGQQQRAVIARGLLVDPTVLVCDEPTSALDALVAEGVMALFEERCISPERLFMIVTHDLAVAARLCDRIIVMHQGRIVEDGSCSQVIRSPRHPYTQQLLQDAGLSTGSPRRDHYEAGLGPESRKP